jgi:hypothetical protein
VKLELTEAYLTRIRNEATVATPRETIFIDADFGCGMELDRESGQVLIAAASRALTLEPRFRQYVFIDPDAAKIDMLRRRVGSRSEARFLHGNPDEILREQILPRLSYEAGHRALLIADTLLARVDWPTLRMASNGQACDLIIDFHDPHPGSTPAKRPEILREMGEALHKNGGFPYIATGQPTRAGLDRSYLLFASHRAEFAKAMGEAMKAIPTA